MTHQQYNLLINKIVFKLNDLKTIKWTNRNDGQFNKITDEIIDSIQTVRQIGNLTFDVIENPEQMKFVSVKLAFIDCNINNKNISELN